MMRMGNLSRTIVVVLLTFLLAHSGKAGYIQGYPRIIDGDTVEINGSNIRLDGIDAPETRQKCKDRSGNVYGCGVLATQKLKRKIGNKPVTCILQAKTDYYGRYIGYCSLSNGSTSQDVGKSLNAWMVYWGYAVAYRQYSTVFVPQEERAARLRRGIWSGTFEMPWDWRKNN